jgi:hypothetical protein
VRFVHPLRNPHVTRLRLALRIGYHFCLDFGRQRRKPRALRGMTAHCRQARFPRRFIAPAPVVVRTTTDMHFFGSRADLAASLHLRKQLPPLTQRCWRIGDSLLRWSFGFCVIRLTLDLLSDFVKSTTTAKGGGLNDD